MFMKSLGTTAAVMLLSAVPAMSATVLIDNFDTAQSVFAPPSDSNMVDGRGLTGIGADERTFFAENTKPANNIGGTSLVSGGGSVSFDNDSGARGTVTLSYSGVGDLKNDRSKGAFFFDVIQFDNLASFSLSGTDGSGGSISYTELLTGGFNPILRFNDPLLEGSETFDFSDVTFLSFSISSSDTVDSVDGTLDSISVSTIPLPASGLLLLGVVGGVAGMRRRKANKAA